MPLGYRIVACPDNTQVGTAVNNVLASLSKYARADEAYWLYLLRQCREHHWRRRQKLLSFASPADWERHCQSVRARFRAALGPMPDRTPLNPRRTDVLERDDYVVEKLLIESQPGFCVTANLYRPKVVHAPAPAILNPVVEHCVFESEPDLPIPG